MAEIVGKEVHRYKIVQPLNGYGMGRAYLARHMALGMDVLFKSLPGWVRTDAASMESLREGVARSTSFGDPAIPPVRELIQEGPILAYVLHYEEGETLAARLQSGKPIPLAEVGRVFRTVCRALRAIHGTGSVHRGVRPTSILLTKAGEVRLIDLGVRLNAVNGRLPSGSSALEAAAYMSPEEAEGRFDSKRSDLYSLGATLYAALTGGPPFRGSTPREILLAHRNRAVTPPAQIHAQVPAALSDLVVRLLSKEPGHRPRSVDDVMAVMDRVFPLRATAGFSGKRQPTGRRGRSKTGSRGTMTGAEKKTRDALPVGRKSNPFLVAALSGLIVLGAGLGMLFAAGVLDGSAGKEKPGPPPVDSRRRGPEITASRHYERFLTGAREAYAKGDLDAALGLVERALQIESTREARDLMAKIQADRRARQLEKEAREAFEKIIDMLDGNRDPSEIGFACAEFLRKYGDSPQAAEVRRIKKDMIELNREKFAGGTPPVVKRPPPNPILRPAPKPVPDPEIKPIPIPEPEPEAKPEPKREAKPKPEPEPEPVPEVPEIERARKQLGAGNAAAARQTLTAALKKYPAAARKKIGPLLVRAVLGEKPRWTQKGARGDLDRDFYVVATRYSEIKRDKEKPEEITGYAGGDDVAMLMFKNYNPERNRGVVAEFKLERKNEENHSVGFRFGVKGLQTYLEFRFGYGEVSARRVERGEVKVVARDSLRKPEGSWHRLVLIEEDGLTLGFFEETLVLAVPAEEFKIAKDLRLFIQGADARLRDIRIRE